MSGFKATNPEPDVNKSNAWEYGCAQVEKKLFESLPKSLADRISALDNGRFSKLVAVMEVTDTCEKCYHFNPQITDEKAGYRCRVFPHCIAATLNPKLQSYIWWKLNWIDVQTHHDNMVRK